jgi:hypothetical protein
MPLIDLSAPVAVPEFVMEADIPRREEPREEPPKEKGVAEPAVTADVSAILLGYALIGVGIAVGIGLWALRDPGTFTPGEGISVFAPLYILAQGIERFIEPFSSYLGSASPDKDKAGTTAEGAGKKRKPEALKLLNQAVADRDAPSAAAWSRVVDRIRRNTAVIAWGLASFLGIALCGLFGIYLLRLVGFTAVPYQVDIAISGLAVGSGTKPLHDLISNVQKAKEQREDPPQKKAA